jgi:hypothetical protein
MVSPYPAQRAADAAGPSPPPVKWTVMVFMRAATIAGNAPLMDAARDDLAEMMGIGSGDALDIFVQIHGLQDVPLRSHVEKSDKPEAAPRGPGRPG